MEFPVEPNTSIQIKLAGRAKQYIAHTLDRPRKQWCKVEPCKDFPQGFIADENNIESWNVNL